MLTATKPVFPKLRRDAPIRTPRKTNSLTRCPNCGADGVGVKDSRPSGNSIRRRRYCGSCDHRWNTYEVDQATVESVRLLAGIAPALRDTLQKLEAIAETLENIGDDAPEMPPRQGRPQND